VTLLLILDCSPTQTRTHTHSCSHSPSQFLLALTSTTQYLTTFPASLGWRVDFSFIFIFTFGKVFLLVLQEIVQKKKGEERETADQSRESKKTSTFFFFHFFNIIHRFFIMSAVVDFETRKSLKKSLLVAVQVLSEHGLGFSARWAAEQAAGIHLFPLSSSSSSSTTTDEKSENQMNVDDNKRNTEKEKEGGGEEEEAEREAELALEVVLERQEEVKKDRRGLLELSRILLAKSFFDLKEYNRTWHALKECQSSKALFLRGYSLFLAGEKRKEEEIQELGDQTPVINQQLKLLKTQLQLLAENNNNNNRSTKGWWALCPPPPPPPPLRFFSYVMSLCSFISLFVVFQECPSFQSRSPFSSFFLPSPTAPLDTFGWYLYGVVLKELDLREAAREAMIRSVLLWPFNWSAWKDIATLCEDFEMVHQVHSRLSSHSTTSSSSSSSSVPPPHSAHPWMLRFWIAHSLLELQQNPEALRALTSLTTAFPRSNYIVAQQAIANYNMREFEVSMELFEFLTKRDPYRLESLDIYSNILYVNEARAKLSYLAHFASTTDKYRPETCCIIGNYYSLISEHEKAVSYFQRALLLNRKYLAAWTLMGHEYIELKNPNAAIQAYRRAVEINPRDYRAWYGLGQTYEILQMHLYALHYYRKATVLRPYDPRMWCAMAGSYENLSKNSEAIICYKRAESNHDRQGIALNKLAKLYHSQNDNDNAALYYLKNLQRRDIERVMSPSFPSTQLNSTHLTSF
jgi:anaphase-promoting complex subunit 8